MTKLKRKGQLPSTPSKSVGTVESAGSKAPRDARAPRANAKKTPKGLHKEREKRERSPGLLGKTWRMFNYGSRSTDESTTESTLLVSKVKPFITTVSTVRHNPSPPIQPRERRKETKAEIYQWKSVYSKDFYSKQVEVVTVYRKKKYVDFD